MIPTAMIYEKPQEAKPYLLAFHDGDGGPVLDEERSEDLDDAAKAAISYARWRQAGDYDPEDALLWALV